MRNIRYLFFISSFLFSYDLVNAQLVVTSSSDANQLAQLLVGGGVVVTNATLTTVGDAAGHFSQTNTNIGIDSGVLLTSGSVFNAPGPNTIASKTTDNGAPGDADLTALSGNETHDATILEFDVAVTGDTLKFNYVFSSEEYNDFVNTGFNDVFAFFISGPGILGNQNIAIIPGTSIPVTINNVNCGSYGQYYVCNDPWDQFGGGCSNQCPSDASGTTIEYDGWTTVLQAISVVQPCQTYHLRLAIADAGDGAYDSGVFIKAGSLSSSGTAVVVNTPYVDPTSNLPAIVEGCFDGSFDFTLSNVPNDTIIVQYQVGGTATEGVDYSSLGDSIVFMPGNQTASVVIHPLTDGITEGQESVTIYLYLTCSTTPYDSATIYIFDEFKVIAKPDTAICVGQSVQLTSTGAGTWLWTPSIGLSCSTCKTTLATPGVTTNYIVTATLGNCSVSDTATIIVNNPQPVLAGPDVSICLGDSIQLNATNANTYLWFPPDGLSCINCASPKASPSATTTYVVTGVNGCFTTQDTIVVTVNPNPVAGASQDVTICPGDSVQLFAVGGTAYSWTPTTGLSDPNINTPVAVAFTTTTYTVLVQNQFGCSDTENVTIDVYNVPDVVLSNDTTIYLGNSVDLHVSGGVTYNWSPSTYLTDANSPFPTSVLPQDTITYYVTVTSADGCKSIDSVTIYVKWDALVVLPTAFSPNNDGNNDLLHLLVRGIFTLNDFSVYNRWGELVFDTNDVNSGWDGTFKGKEQPVGVYVYLFNGLDHGGKDISGKGSVTLVR